MLYATELPSILSLPWVVQMPTWAPFPERPACQSQWLTAGHCLCVIGLLNRGGNELL